LKRALRPHLLALSAFSFTLIGAAQDAAREAKPQDGVGMMEQPCAPTSTLSASVRELLVELFIEPRKLVTADLERLTSNDQFKAFLKETREQAALDWAGLCRYRAANQQVLAESSSTKLVFMGDSITENWALADPRFFQGGRLNRGISGQTSPQMLVRFRSDVIALRPTAVHILAGTNDVAGNTGPTRAQDFKDNIMSMAELARAHGIRVILGSVPPAATFSWQPQLQPAPRIRELNSWLSDYAARNRFEYIDYHARLAGTAGELDAALGNDGVHPNRAGYRVMRELLEQRLALRKADDRE
jgi:lysophospholipase L1-like esterase